MKTTRPVVRGLSLFAVAAIGSAYFIGRARAAGVPATTPLTYSGTLTDTSGVALTGLEEPRQVQFWDMATAGTIVCTTGSAAQTLVNGGFSIALPDTCVTAIHTTQDLWAEVLVDGASTGRTKLGAVPYALEADSAVKVAKDVSGTGMRICSGQTPVGSTAWTAYGAQVVVTVDTTACGFTSKPIYHTVLAGTSSHWTTTGGSNPLIRRPRRKTQFQVFINNGAAGITPVMANATDHQLDHPVDRRRKLIVKTLVANRVVIAAISGFFDKSAAVPGGSVRFRLAACYIVPPRMAKEEDFAAMFAEYEEANKGKRRVPPVQPGDRVRGKVTSVGRDTVFVELDDGRGEAMIDGAELRDADGQVTIKTGDTIEAMVIEGGGRGEPMVLRRQLARASGAQAPAELARAFELGLPVEGTISAVNKGGVDVTVAGVRGVLVRSRSSIRGARKMRRGDGRARS